MKVNSVGSYNYARIKNQPTIDPAGTVPDVKTGFRAITFKSGNRGDVLHVIAELKPSFNTGGVATVGTDYKTLNNISANEHGRTVIFTPYYNGNITYDKNSGELIEKVEVHRVPQNLPDGHKLKGKEGTPFFTTQDLSKKNITDVLGKESDYILLEEVAEKEMKWGLQEKAPIKLFKIPAEKSQCPPNTDIFFVYTEGTASMAKPYEGGGYATTSNPLVKSWNGDPYAQFDKASVELMKDVNKKVSGFDPATVICSDSHAAYVSHFMAERNAAGEEYFVGKKPTQVGHNLGDGYIGITSPRNMIVNLGTSTEQLEKLRSSKEYLDALIKGEEDQFLLKFLDKLTTKDKKIISAMDIPVYYGLNGYLPMFSTVSEGYHEATITNKEVAPSLFENLKKLNEKGGYIGLTNPLSDPSATAFKPLGMSGYGKSHKYKLANGKEITVDAFEHFDKEKSTDLKYVREIKRKNKINLLQRFQPELDGLRLIGENGTLASVQASENLLRAGLLNKDHEIIGGISQKYIDQLKKGEDIKLAVSWGRGDFQKGLDTVVDGFEKFVNKTGDKNTLLLLGGDLKISPEEGERVINRVKLLSQKDAFKGRIVLMDGFAPGLPFASAADVSIFPSRFAPCELTDLESKHMLSTPIVTNCQGLAQKNFDPDIATEEGLADAFKTKHDFYMSESECLKDGVASAEAKADFEKIKNKLVEEEKTKFKIRTQKELTEVELYERLHANKKYEKALRELKDSIISDELAGCMDRALNKYRNGEVAEKILKNQVNIETTWEKNGWLSKVKTSAGELYRQKHINAQAKNITESDLLRFDFSDLTPDRGTVSESNLSFGQKIRKFFGSKSGKWTAIGVITAAALGGIGYNLYKKSNTVAKTSEQNGQNEQKHLSAIV